MYELKKVNSLLINCVWRAREYWDGKTYDDPANEYWSLSFIRQTNGSLAADLFGPSLKPRVLGSTKGEEYWGIEFNAHVALKEISKGAILNSHRSLKISGADFHLCGSSYKVPEYADLEAFAIQLEADGTIVSDQRIYRVLTGKHGGFSERSRQRHFKEIAGLTEKQIEQMKRARYAFYLLQCGSTSVEAALTAGYADQSHMIRAFKVLWGQTPARIIADYLKKS